MTTPSHVLAVDLGTGGPKVALLTTTGELVAHEFVPTELVLLPDGGAEQRPDEWWDAITGAARKLLDQRLVPVDGIVAVSVTGQWSGTVAVDEAGEPLMNAVIWMDSRGSRQIREVIGGRASFQGYDLRKLRRWVRLTGGAPGRSGKDPGAHILWIRHERPDIYRATHKFLEPVDWLNHRFTGRFASSYDGIVAHWVTDNRDIHHVTYDDGLLALSGLDRSQLPDLVPSASVVGPIRREVAADLGLRDDVVVVTATGDVQSASVGSGAVGDFESHLYIGTSSWLTCHVPFKKTNLLKNIASIPSAIPGRYLVADEHETAGACLTFLRDNLFWPDDGLGTGPAPDDAWARFDRVVEGVAPGSDRVLFTPWLNGERTPVDDHTIRGGFHNLSLRARREHLVRAVYEGVAFNSRWLLDAVEDLAGRRMGAINFVGGGANSPVWAQIHADVLDRPIRRMADPIDVNVRGAALLAGLALGHLGVADIGRAVRVVETHEPERANRGVYEELYREFVSIYRRTKGIHARLNG